MAKTKLTLNIDDDVVRKAKKVSSKKKQSLSSVVEGYLVRYAGKALPAQEKNKNDSIVQKIKKLSRPVEVSDADLKKERQKFLDKKYGS